MLSTGNVFTEINFSNGKTTLIYGDNGAGKSTLLDALLFVLFGRPFRNINKPQLVNTITRKNLVVEIEFRTQNKDFKIVRGIKPNIFEIYCDGSLINQSSDVRDYQDHLEKQILKTNYRSFCQVVILGSASYVPFMQLAAQQRRSVIEDLLDLEIFTVMNTLLKEKVQDNLTLINENANERILSEEKIKLVRKHLQEVQAISDEQIAQKNKSIEKIRENIASEKKIIESLQEEVAKLRGTITDERVISNKIEKLKRLQAQLEMRETTLVTEIEFFNNNESCPTCKQNIDHKFKYQTVDDSNIKLNELIDGKNKLIAVYNDTNARLDKIIDTKSKISDLLSDIQQSEYKIQHWKHNIYDLESEIVNLRTSYKSDDNVRIVDLEKDLLTIKTKGIELQEERQVLTAAALLLKDDGIKTKIINQYVPIINKFIQKYLADFDFFCEFYLDEKFNETIKSRYRDEFSYNSFSEGEKTRIDLAVLFTWRALAKMRNSLSTNLLIFDEIFDGSLSSQGADDLLKILDTMGKDTSVLVISHRDTLFEKFHNSIKFTKISNFSILEESEQ